jgi:hypothetical protein
MLLFIIRSINTGKLLSIALIIAKSDNGHTDAHSTDRLFKKNGYKCFADTIMEHMNSRLQVLLAADLRVVIKLKRFDASL